MAMEMYELIETDTAGQEISLVATGTRAELEVLAEEWNAERRDEGTDVTLYRVQRTA